MPTPKKAEVKAFGVIIDGKKAFPKTTRAKKPPVKLNLTSHYEQFANAANSIADTMAELGISKNELLEACEEARAELTRERYPELFQ